MILLALDTAWSGEGHSQVESNAGVGAVILSNENFTISLSENWIISFSRHRVRLLLLKNVAGINTGCVPDEVFPSLYSLISFIQEEYLYLLLSPLCICCESFWAQRSSLWIEMELLVFPLFKGGKQSNWRMDCFSPDLFLCSAHFSPSKDCCPKPWGYFLLPVLWNALAAGLEGSRPSWGAAAQGSLLLLPVNCKKNVIYQGRCSTRI